MPARPAPERRIAAAVLALGTLAGCGDAGPAAAGALPLEELLARGREPYLQHCAACHRADGSGLAGSFPALDGSPVVRGPKAAHIETVLRGRPGTAMPAFAQQLDDEELAALLTYERNAWLFKTFDAVQAAEVAAVRERFVRAAR